MDKIPLMDLKAQFKKIQPEINIALEKIFADCSFIGGYEKDQFEKEFAEMMGVKYCIGVANGTDAIFLILKSMGIGQGDSVITVANSFISSSEAVSATGAKPIFIDVDEKNFLIDIDLLEKYLIENKVSKNIKALVLVHLYGQIANMDRITEICNKFQIQIVEDCAQSHLASFNGRIAGSWGAAGSFSFYPGKNLGAAGDAGAITTNDDELYKKMKMMANHGRIEKYNHVFEGFNSRLDNIQAAVLRVKMKYIKQWTELRKDKAIIYDQLLENVSGVIKPILPDREKHVYHLYTVRVKNRDQVLERLKQNGIEASVHYPISLPMLKAYSYLNHTAADFPVSLKLQEEILSLPLYPEITLEQQKHVVSILEKSL